MLTKLLEMCKKDGKTNIKHPTVTKKRVTT